MLTANYARCVGVGIGLIVIFAANGVADDEQRKDAPANEVAVSADLENWKIEFNGYMDQPRRRPNFHVSLAHDGAMLVETWHGKDERRKLFEGKLTAQETRQFFDRAAKITNSYDKKKRDGGWGDGWGLTVVVSAKKYSKTAKFTQQHDPTDEKRTPDFAEMVKLIRGKLKEGESFPPR